MTQSDAPPVVRSPEKTSPARRASLVAWVCLLIVWVVWGSTYLAIRVGVETMPPLLLPTKGPLGLRDYEKAFSPHLKSGADIFDLRGVDRDQGALVVVRPDQHVAHVLPLDAYDELAGFFAGFLARVA